MNGCELDSFDNFVRKSGAQPDATRRHNGHAMLQLIDITLKRGEKTVFDQAGLTVHAGHTAGVVGRNGVGKTTLFELVRGRLLPEEGDVLRPRKWRLAWLDQAVEPSPRSALDFTLDGDRGLRAVEARIEAAERAGDNEALALAHVEFEEARGYDAEARAGEILHGLGFHGEDFGKPHREFSGGWRIRLNLARTLMSPSELLLLDEPTNHLDLDAALWLETWLKRYPGTLLVISHDRDFLDAVCDEIVHVADGKTATYTGSYSSFERQRAEALERQAAQHAKQQLEIRHMQSFIDRFRAKAKKARMAQSRLKALERMERVAPVHARSPYRFTFPNPEQVSNPTLSLDEAVLGYLESPVLGDLTLRIYPGDRIGVLGVNGAGKTTLLKALADEIEPLSGALTRGRHSSVGYFAQHQMESLRGDSTALATIHASPGEPLGGQQARDYLGRWGFSGEMVERPLATFSGGEKARLVLALIARTRPALLLLDEPTNHLDIEMREALALALQDYDGALVLVSHDRHLLRQCADTLWLVAHGRVDPFTEGLDAYAEIHQGRQGRAARHDRKSKRRQSAERRAAMRPLTKKLARLERAIDGFTGELDELSTVLSNSATFEHATTEQISEMLARQGRIRKRLAQTEAEWLEVQERIEEAG